LQVLVAQGSSNTHPSTEEIWREMNPKNFLLVILIPLISTRSYVSIVHGSSWETDKTTTVSRFIDGDTFDAASGDRIRLADINAPERGESGYEEAKDLLVSLLDNKTVYLDIDDLSRVDRYGRLVCVVYVDYNSTHLLNVNKALLVRGVAEIWDHDNNEFNPYMWALYVQRPAVPRPYGEVASAILLLAVAVITILLSSKRLRR